MFDSDNPPDNNNKDNDGEWMDVCLRNHLPKERHVLSDDETTETGESKLAVLFTKFRRPLRIATSFMSLKNCPDHKLLLYSTGKIKKE